MGSTGGDGSCQCPTCQSSRCCLGHLHPDPGCSPRSSPPPRCSHPRPACVGAQLPYTQPRPHPCTKVLGSLPGLASLLGSTARRTLRKPGPSLRTRSCPQRHPHGRPSTVCPAAAPGLTSAGHHLASVTSYAHGPLFVTHCFGTIYSCPTCSSFPRSLAYSCWLSKPRVACHLLSLAQSVAVPGAHWALPLQQHSPHCTVGLLHQLTCLPPHSGEGTSCHLCPQLLRGITR